MARTGMRICAAGALLAAVVGCDQAATSQDVVHAAPPRTAHSAVRHVGQGTSADAAQAARRLIGAWIAAADGGDVSGGNQVDARMNQALAEYTFRFEFQASGQVLIHRGVGPSSPGQWGVVEADAQAAVVSIVAPDFTGESAPRHFVVRFADDRRFTLSPTDATDSGLTMAFTRLAVP